MASSSAAAPATASPTLRISLSVTLLLGVSLLIAALAGPRYGMLLLIGGGIGATLEALRFGFAGPWRQLILARNPAGFLAQLICMGLVALVAFPLLAAFPDEISGAHAPVGFAMIAGAGVFGFCMQLVLGCGSGTLVNAGSGNPVAVLALPFFAIGSFAGTLHLGWWTSIGSMPTIVLTGAGGLIITLAGLAIIGGGAFLIADRQYRSIPPRLWIAAIIVAALAIIHLITAGQPWGVVYGLGLWVAKGVTAAGGDVSQYAFWSAPLHQTRLEQSILTDVTSLTNLGLIGGAALATFSGRRLKEQNRSLTAATWLSAIIAGFLLGYSSRLAFGCNVGALFSGITTGSLHGWVWLASAFIGSWAGVKARAKLGMDKAS